jgi:hypothetical protein
MSHPAKSAALDEACGNKNITVIAAAPFRRARQHEIFVATPLV